jgi:hypothetical protein
MSFRTFAARRLMARAAVASQRLVRHLAHVRSAHHHPHAGGAECVGDPVRPGHHSGHRADADQVDLPFEREAHQLGVAHRLGVAVDQQHLVLGRSERLEQEHPQVRHEIPRHPVIRAVK